MDPLQLFNPDLIRRYDKSGPRYTSYPTAVQFHDGFGETDYRGYCARSNAERPLRPLSLYFHVPFCDTVCFYCACNKIVTKDRTRAAPYLERLHREIALQGAQFDRARTVEQLHWGGGTPTFLSNDEMRELMAVTGRHFTLRDDDQGEYSIEVDPREVRAGTLETLRAIGFNRLSMGVQDFDERVQRAVNRIQSREETLAVLTRARRLGFGSVSMDLIYGLPHQTAASFAATLREVIAARPDRLSVFNYAHLPELFKPQRRINAADLPSPPEKLAILGTAIEALTAAGYEYIGMDHFALPGDELAVAQQDGTLYRNFQGYSTHADCDLVGLGVTSISMVGDSYAQNVKTEEEYYAALDASRLPVFRGIALKPDDRLRRAVITRLICHFRLDIPSVEREFGICFPDYFGPEMEELKTFEADGLVEITPTTLTIPPAGKLLIRNCCMVFDRYLREQQPARFSKVI